jgi:CheY-specific phosphatase CheX
MWHEQAGAALSEATRDVLETMCFVAAGEVPDPMSPDAKPIAAQVEFRGYWTGRCIVEMPESCARVIAGNFIGVLDPDQVDAVHMIELMCEFANMICGGTITRLQCPGIVVLAPPHLIWLEPSSEPALEGESGNSAVKRWLDTGDGVVHVSFQTRGSFEDKTGVAS